MFVFFCKAKQKYTITKKTQQKYCETQKTQTKIGTDKETGKAIACKIQLQANDATFQRELEVLKTLNGCPYVAQILHQETIGEKAVVVMEYLDMELGKLHEFCNHSFDDATLLKIALDLINGLEAIHDLCVIHRDIKPDNMMYSRSPEATICKLQFIDFGLSKIYFNKEKNKHCPFREGKHGSF